MGRRVSINRFTLMGSGANAIIAAKIDPKTAVATQLQASQLQIGPHRCSARTLGRNRRRPAPIPPRAPGTGTLSGNSLGLSGAFASGQTNQETPEFPAVQLDIALDQLHPANNIGLRQLRGYVHRTDNHWQRYQLTAALASIKRMKQKAEQKSDRPAQSNQKDGGGYPRHHRHHHPLCLPLSCNSASINWVAACLIWPAANAARLVRGIERQR
jgi:hypothetical protein